MIIWILVKVHWVLPLLLVSSPKVSKIEWTLHWWYTWDTNTSYCVLRIAVNGRNWALNFLKTMRAIQKQSTVSADAIILCTKSGMSIFKTWFQQDGATFHTSHAMLGVVLREKLWRRIFHITVFSAARQEFAISPR